MISDRPLRPWRDLVPSAIVASIVAAMLLYWSASTGLDCDELLFLRAIRSGPIGGLMQIGSSHPPLVRWLLSPLQWVDRSDLMLRLPSILAAVACVFVWGEFLRRFTRDTITVTAILACMALNAAWLEIAYRLLPYSFLTLLVSVHALCWLQLLKRPTGWTMTLFVATGAACGWTHFFGVNVLLADQLLWLAVIIRSPSQWRRWLSTSFVTGLLVLPVIPLALFYMRAERPYAILDIENYAEYFWTSSSLLFGSTFNDAPLPAMSWLLWYGFAIVMLLRYAFSGRARDKDGSPSDGEVFSPGLLGAVAATVFISGFPAAQLQSVLAEKAIWTRYLTHGLWAHWPLLMLATGSFVVHQHRRPRMLRAIALSAAAICLLGVIISGGIKPRSTFAFSQVIAHLRQRACEGDVFFAQDMDMWVGESNFDRLWFQRYSPVTMPVVSGPPMRRFEIGRDGLPLDSAPSTAKRIWVYSSPQTVARLQQTRHRSWTLSDVRVYGRNYPLALFERVEAERDRP